MRNVRRARRPLVALIALVVALAVGYGIRAAHSPDGSGARPSATSSAASASVALSALPPQAAATLRLIESDGPFPYPRNDGVVFHNDEHHLPRESAGFYREYTVPTPGSADRGARRLIAGRDGRFWYTGDHYASFRQVDIHR